jgi:large subunit ribosomal protein L9
MKILLLKDAPRVGNKGQIIDVADSYGMNAFVNKGLAKIASTADIKGAEQKDKIKKESKERESDKYIEVFKRLEKTPLVFKKKVDDKGHMYAKLSVTEVVDAIYEKEKISLSDKQIKMQEVHELGNHEVEVTVNSKKYILNIKVER